MARVFRHLQGSIFLAIFAEGTLVVESSSSPVWPRPAGRLLLRYRRFVSCDPRIELDVAHVCDVEIPKARLLAVRELGQINPISIANKEIGGHDHDSHFAFLQRSPTVRHRPEGGNVPFRSLKIRFYKNTLFYSSNTDRSLIFGRIRDLLSWE